VEDNVHLEVADEDIDLEEDNDPVEEDIGLAEEDNSYLAEADIDLQAVDKRQV
jgi:hypothetical protein